MLIFSAGPAAPGNQHRPDFGKGSELSYDGG